MYSSKRDVLLALATVILVLVNNVEQSFVGDSDYAKAPTKVLPPSAPTKVTVNLRNNSLDISWSKPILNANPLGGYLVDWSLQNNNIWPTSRQQQFLSNNTKFYSIRIYVTTTGWDIYLTPFNRYPNGTIAYGVRYANKVSNLPLAPGNLRYVNATIGPKSIVLKWTAPLGRVDGYLIQYSIRETKTWPPLSSIYLDNKQKQYPIAKTNKTKGYDVYLTPYNKLSERDFRFGQSWRLYHNGAAGILASALLPSILAFLTMTLFNKQ